MASSANREDATADCVTWSAAAQNHVCFFEHTFIQSRKYIIQSICIYIYMIIYVYISWSMFIYVDLCLCMFMYVYICLWFVEDMESLRISLTTGNVTWTTLSLVFRGAKNTWNDFVIWLEYCNQRLSSMLSFAIQILIAVFSRKMHSPHNNLRCCSCQVCVIEPQALENI